MGLFKDITNLFKKHNLKFVEKRQEAGDAVTFIFKNEGSLEWIPGQHGIFAFDKKKLKGGSTRAFSIASTPEEGILMISMRVPVEASEYKQELMKLKPGDTLTMRGPIGSFYNKDLGRPVLFVAGGIGITPYRALLGTYSKDSSKAGAVTLLYSESKGEYIYKDEIDALAGKHDFINVKYITGREEFSREFIDFSKQYRNNATYFISGSVEMVKSFKKLLKGQGVSGKNIKADPFVGY